LRQYRLATERSKSSAGTIAEHLSRGVYRAYAAHAGERQFDQRRALIKQQCKQRDRWDKSDEQSAIFVGNRHRIIRLLSVKK
jgi:hypothetical protein